jgi:hypothetical protein
MHRPESLGHLGDHDWEQLQDLLDRFEDAWSKADSVDLGRYLPLPTSPLRAVALQELVKADLEIRWRRGQSVTLEDYCRRFPELADPTPQLIYEEYRARHLYGDRPPLIGYQIRFPEQFSALQKLAEAQPFPTGAAIGCSAASAMAASAKSGARRRSAG